MVGDSSNNWMDGWLNAQQSYWKSWADLAQRGMKTPEAPKNPWAEGIAQWWRAVEPMTPSAGRDVFDKLMDLSRGYFSMAERYVADSEGGAKGMDVLNSWFENTQKAWTDWMHGGMRPNEQMKGLMTFWDLPLDTWNRLSASLMPMPGDFTQAFHPEGSPAAMRDKVNRFLSIPAVGYTRESQEQYQRLAQLMMDYGVATQAYQMAFGKLAVETTKDFQSAMQGNAKEGKTYTSLREVYDQWVEVSEAAYARFVMTREYQELYGHLVNSLIAVKHQMARMVDQTLEAMHMPTHAEISTLQCRQQELRRENIRLKNEIKAIHEQLEAMRQRSIQPAAAVQEEAPQPAAQRAAAKPAARSSGKTAPARVVAKPAASKPAAKKTGGTRK
jgi:class III poly(R)-hydroxyalkanoic acid synthase PhaE subunit